VNQIDIDNEGYMLRLISHSVWLLLTHSLAERRGLLFYLHYTNPEYYRDLLEVINVVFDIFKTVKQPHWANRDLWPTISMVRWRLDTQLGADRTQNEYVEK